MKPSLYDCFTPIISHLKALAQEALTTLSISNERGFMMRSW